MKKGLEIAYEKVMGNSQKAARAINESKEVVQEAELVKGQKTKAGQDVIDGYKESGIGGAGKSDKKDPKEAEAKINPGHGEIKTEGRELSDMLPESKFDTLFKKQLVEEEDGIDRDMSPLEGGDFDEEEGEFPSQADDDETGEEVDVATELRMVIDRLTEVAERLGAFDEEMDEAGEEVGEGDIEDDIEPDLEESHVKLDSFPDTVSKMTSPSNKKVKSAFSNPGGKAKVTGGPGSGKADGKLSPARKTKLKPGGKQKHPDVKGTMGKTGAGVFDNM